MHRISILTAFLTIVTVTFYGQSFNGAIKIHAQDKMTTEPIVDTFFISVNKWSLNKTTKYKTMPDKEGNVTFNLDTGRYDISVSIKNYSTDEMSRVIVGQGKAVNLTCYLRSLVVSKIELILLKNNIVFHNATQIIPEKIIELDKSKIKEFIKDFNAKESGKSVGPSCSFIRIWAGETFTIYSCNGNKVTDIEGNEFFIHFNIIEKYWGIKKKELCP